MDNKYQEIKQIIWSLNLLFHFEKIFKPISCGFFSSMKCDPIYSKILIIMSLDHEGDVLTVLNYNVNCDIYTEESVFKIVSAITLANTDFVCLVETFSMGKIHWWINKWIVNLYVYGTMLTALEELLSYPCFPFWKMLFLIILRK